MFLGRLICAAVFLQGFLLLAQTAAIPNLQYKIDIAARTGTKFNVETGCNSQPFAHDAKIWSVIIETSFGSMDGFSRADPNFPTYFDASNNLYIVVFDGAPGELSLSDKGTNLKVVLHNVAGYVWLEVAQLTLAQVADTADAVRNNSGLVGNLLSQKGYTMKLYKARVTRGGKQLPPLEAYLALIGDIDPTKEEGRSALQDRLDRLTKAETELVRPEGAVLASTTLLDSRPAGVIQLDQSSVDRLTNLVAQLASTGKGTSADSANPPILVIDEPCVSFAVTPVVSGSSPSFASTFRLRYDIYSPDGRSFFKFRANGDGDLGGSYFNRAEGAVDVGVNNKGAVNVAGGATGGYAFTRVNGQVVDEWTAAGKFQAHLPALFFAVRPGALTRPILNVEGGASGGHHVDTTAAPGAAAAIARNETAFVAKSSFLYTVRPSPRFSVDLQAAAGASDSEFFGNRHSFSNIRIEARFNFIKDYDFVARYDCGRRDPAYIKFCGWQTGLILVTGR